jgi:hypothetical protein
MESPTTTRDRRLDGDVRLLFMAAMAIFVVTVLTESSPLKRTFSPILGLSILLGMLALALRLRSGGTAVAGRPIANSTPSP